MEHAISTLNPSPKPSGTVRINASETVHFGVVIVGRVTPIQKYPQYPKKPPSVNRTVLSVFYFLPIIFASKFEEIGSKIQLLVPIFAISTP